MACLVSPAHGPSGAGCSLQVSHLTPVFGCQTLGDSELLDPADMLHCQIMVAAFLLTIEW